MIFIGERLATEEGLPLDFGDFRVSGVLGVRGAVAGVVVRVGLRVRLGLVDGGLRERLGDLGLRDLRAGLRLGIFFFSIMGKKKCLSFLIGTVSARTRDRSWQSRGWPE